MACTCAHTVPTMERLVPLGCSFALGWAACYTYLSNDKLRSPLEPSVQATTLRAVDMREGSSSSGSEDSSKGPSEALLYFRQHPDDDVKMVFAVRNDLKMTKGKIGAQVGHAAVDCAERASQEEPELYEEWEECGCTKVCLKVASEEELLALAQACESKGLITSVIEDEGRTQIESGSRTVCGVGPGPAGLIDAACGHLKLL